MTEETLKNTLWVLQEAGFILRIPGGSNRKGDESNFVALIGSDKELHPTVYVVPYNPEIKIERQYKEDEFEETSEASLILKVVEQTGIRIYQPQKIFEKDFPNNRQEVKKERHIKKLFQTQDFDISGIRVAGTLDGRIDPPVEIPVYLLPKYICPQHQWMVEEIEKYIIRVSKF